jgi:hypothetical protein
MVHLLHPPPELAKLESYVKYYGPIGCSLNWTMQHIFNFDM